ncbi:unnamed protein product, partial [Rotaria sp. Silwood1]
MSHRPSSKEKKEFHSFVLYLKKIHPSWKVKDITTFLLQSENPPCDTTTNPLRIKVWRILKRNQVNDLPRSGAPRTTTKIKYIQTVKEAIRLKKNASIRNVIAKLQKQGYKTSKSSVWRVKTLLKLKWWERKTVQKLTTNQKIQRDIIAKRLRKKYGIKKGNKLYEWIHVLNTDFSGTFTLTPQCNQHNQSWG